MAVIASGEITIVSMYDGESVFRAWSDNDTGSLNFSTTNSNRLYLGTYVGLTAPTNPSQYSWTRVKGDTGAPGVDAYTVILSNEAHTFPGTTNRAKAQTINVNVIVYKGATQIASSVTAISGQVTGLTTNIDSASNNTTNNKFIVTSATTLATQNGVLAITITADGKTFVKNMSWAVSYEGAKGETGKGETTRATDFQIAVSGTVVPSGTWVSTAPDTSLYKGQYLWQRTTINYTEGSPVYTYMVNYIPLDGQNGNGIASTTVHYIQQASATAPAEGSASWSTTRPAPVKGQYLWTKVTTNYNTGNPSVAITSTYHGQDGAPGTNAKLVTLSSTGQIFTKPKSGAVTPAKLTVTASAQNTTVVAGSWQYSTDGGAFTTTKPSYVTVINATTIDVANSMPHKILVIKVATSDNVEDVMTIARVEDGIDGSDAYTIALSNESHTFAGTVDKAVAGSTTVDIIAYKGTTRIASTINSISNQITGKLTASITGNNTTSNKFTVNATNTLDTQSGILIINLTVDGQTFVKNFSWSVAYTGASGVDAKILTLTADNQVFKQDKDGNIAPTTIKITATAQNLSVPTANANWQYSTNGGTFTTTLPTGVTRSSGVVTVNGNTFTGNTLTVRVFNGAIEDRLTVFKVIDGIDSYTHVAYADDNLGNGFSFSSEGKYYMGIYTGNLATAPDSPNSYTWTLIKGLDSDHVIKITSPQYPLTAKQTQQNGIVFPTIYGNTKHSVPVGEGRNLVLNSAVLEASGLGAASGSRAEYRTINTGQSYMDLEDGETITISFDIEMKIATVNPTLQVYNSNLPGPVGIPSVSVSNQLQGNVGDTINKRISFTTHAEVRDTPRYSYNTLEFYSGYGSNNFYKISKLKVEKGSEATDWTPAPEDTPQNLLSIGNEVELVSSVGRENLILNSKDININPRTGTAEKLDEFLGVKNVIKITNPTTTMNMNPAQIMTENTILGESYTLSVLFTYKGKLGNRPQLYLGPGAYITVEGDIEENKFNRIYITSRNVKSAITRIHMHITGFDEVYLADWKIEKGTIPTPYSQSHLDIQYDTYTKTIYKTNLLLDEPLRSIGDIKDKLFRDSDGIWKIERNIAIVSVADISSWVIVSAAYQTATTSQIGGTPSVRAKRNTQPISSYFKTGASAGSGDEVGIAVIGNNPQFRIKFNNNEIGVKPDSTTEERLVIMRDWLNNNSNIVIQYEREEKLVEILPQSLQDKLNSLPTYSPETWVYTANNSKTYLGEEVVPEMEGEFWGAGWAANFRLEHISLTPGPEGRGIEKIVKYFLTSPNNTGITIESPGWTVSSRTPDNINKYLWTYEVTFYTDNTSFTGEPYVVSLSEPGANGVSVIGTDIEFYKSTSATELTGGSWTTTAPTWTNGTYIWTRTTTRYSSGSPTVSPAINITGSQGSSGAAGKGITSVTEQYYLSTSSTSRKDGTWVDNVAPAWEPNKYMWTRLKIVWNNPTSTTYTTEVVSTEWEKIGNIITDLNNAPTWKKEYRVNTANGLPLTKLDGSPLNIHASYDVTAKIISTTSTVTSIQAIFKANPTNGTGTGNSWELIILKALGTISNHPEFYINQDGLPAIRLYMNSTLYTVEVTHSEYIGTETPYSLAKEQADNKVNNPDFVEYVRDTEIEISKIGPIGSWVESTKDNVLITHTDEYVEKITTTETNVDTLESRVVDVEETKKQVDTYFQFDDKLTIGKSNSQLKLTLDNQRIEFLDGDTVGTYITGNTMVSQNIVITQGLTLPNHTVSNENGLTVFRPKK